MDSRHKSRVFLGLLVLALMLINNTKAAADSLEEKQKCIEQLNGLSTCLPYLGRGAKAPTPDCCDGLEQAIKNNNKRCICIVIKDRNDPDLGLNINLTLALGLPSTCKAPDNFSQCPALLHLDPKSAEAQSFNQLHQSHNSNSGGSGSAPSPAEEGIAGTINAAKNEACYKRRRLLESLIVGFVIWYL